MLKYAFISEIKNITPEEYSAVYKNEECYNLVIGSPDMKITEELVKKLADEGYTLMNFCGAFDGRKIERLEKAAGDKVKMSHVKYFPEELDKLNNISKRIWNNHRRC